MAGGGGVSTMLDISVIPHQVRESQVICNNSDAPVYVSQTKWELDAMLLLYRGRRPGRVLEIGTWHGGTLWHWLQDAAPGATVVSVDSYAVGVDNRHMYLDWCPDGVTVVALEGDSRDAGTISEVETYGPYDWVFIDAGHHYDEVKADWLNYKRMAAPGAVVLFHDILPHPEHVIEVPRLWREIQAQGFHTQEIMADPDGVHGIGVVYLK